MTVAELKAELAKMPQEATVLVTTDVTGYFGEVRDVLLEENLDRHGERSAHVIIEGE